jgi:integrase
MLSGVPTALHFLAGRVKTMPGTEPYIRLKKRTTYFRRRVPSALKAVLGMAEINLNLGVINRWEAEALGLSLAAQCTILFRNAQAAAMDGTMIRGELKKLLADTVAHLTGRQQNQRMAMAHEGHVFPGPVDEKIRIECELAAQLVEAHDRGFHAYDHEFVRERLAASGLDPQADALEYEALAAKFTLVLALTLFDGGLEKAERNGIAESRRMPLGRWRAQAEALRKQLGLVESNELAPANSVATAGVPSYAREQEAVSALPPTILELVPPIAEHLQPPEPAEPIVATAIPARECDQWFSAIFDQTLADRIGGNELAETARKDQNQAKSLWIGLVGDKPIADYKREHMRQFRDAIRRLPKIYWKSAADRKLSILQVIADREANGDYVKITSKSMNKHISAIASVFAYWKKQKILPDNHPEFWHGFFINEKFSEKRAGNEDRPAFTDNQIELIFKHPVFTGRSPDRYFNQKGNHIIRDALYWAPLIAAYSMMRREEICALRVGDIKEEVSEDSTFTRWCFDLTAPDKRIKSAAGVRKVPIHSNLLELGLIKDLVEGRRPEEILFAELSNDNAHQAFGVSVGKKFASLLKSLDIKIVRKDGTEPGGGFHPFRHAGITKLIEAGIPLPLVSQLAGHDVIVDNNGNVFETVTKNYIKTMRIEVSAAAIDRIEHPIDIKEMASNAIRGRAVKFLFDHYNEP